jgi:hypothetical protein
MTPPIIQDPAQIDDWLKDGIAVGEIMRRSSWTRAQIQARAAGLGLSISPTSDKPVAAAAAARPASGNGRTEPGGLRQAAQAMIRDRRSAGGAGEPMEPAPASDPYAEMLARAVQSAEPKVRRRGERILEDLAGLRAALELAEEQDRVRREIAEHEARIKELRLTLRTPDGRHKAPIGQQSEQYRAVVSERNRDRYERDRARMADLGVTREEIREWAAANGHDVAAQGFLPRGVLDAYEAAQQAERGVAS